MGVTKHQFISQVKRLPAGILLAFTIRQAWAALFGGLLLIGIVITTFVDLPWLSQYDWLFLYAIAIQIFMLASKLEKPHEVVTIFLFHLVGLGMELFKTSSQIGAWSYPGDAIFKVAGVPLFAGFMYAAVGSYIARAWRVLGLSFSNYPNRICVGLLGLAIYANFFTHHFFYDVRYVLFALVVLLYGRTRVAYSFDRKIRRMPLLLGFVLIAIVIWGAENLSTYMRIWLYANQLAGWHMVSAEKLGSWFLLMIISFIMVDMLYYIRTHAAAKSPSVPAVNQ